MALHFVSGFPTKDGMEIQTIVFDFGNVVGFFDYARAITRLAPHAGITAEAIRTSVYGGELEDAYESGRVSTAEFLGRLRQLCQLRCNDEEAGAAFADIFWPNEAVCALVPRLKPRYRLLLGSNTCDLHARQFRQQFADTLRHFDALVLSHEVGARKPTAAFYEHARRLAGCTPQECLFIDDLPANVHGAVACGWQGIVYRGFDDLRQRLTTLGILAP
jgi:putative hydrolase of the HAD superfamily